MFFSRVILPECGLTLSQRSTTFLRLTSVERILRRFPCTCCSCWGYKFAFSVGMHNRKFKMNNTAVISLCTQNNFSSMKLCIWSRLQGLIIVNPLPIALKIVIKGTLFITWNNILEKTSPMSVLDMALNNLMVRFQNHGTLENAEYPFIAIAPRSTLARGSGTR